MFKDAFAKDEVTEDAEGGLDTTDDSTELDGYLADGWMLIEDAQALDCPTPYEGQLTIGGTTIIKPNQKWFDEKFDKGGGEMFAGFGGVILPLLIGGGVLMALNTSKKIKK